MWRYPSRASTPPGPRALLRSYYDRCSRVRRRERASGEGPERSTSEMRPRLHSFGGAGAFRRAPPTLERPSQSSRALLGVKMCPSARRDLSMWSPSSPPSRPGRCRLDHLECGVRVDPSSRRPAGLRVRDEPRYQNLEELRKHPERADLDEISREYGYRLCPEGQNLEDEAIYENVLSVQRIQSAEVRLVPMSEVPYYEDRGYVATQVLSRSGTFPQCPPHTWSRLQHACRPRAASLRIVTVNYYLIYLRFNRPVDWFRASSECHISHIGAMF